MADLVIAERRDLVNIADAIRSKAGITDALTLGQMPNAISEIGSGSSGSSGNTPASKKDVNFYDYDGTLLHSYTAAEAQALTELPPLPEQAGLICQGWNWSLEDIKAHNRAVDVGAMYITDDGTTRIYITLQEGKTSPMLGCCPNGTVTVDWGDGTTPDTLTGTSTTSDVKWTPTHNYAASGDYIIKLTIKGSCGIVGATSSTGGSYILRYSSGSNNNNIVYANSIRKIEIGKNITIGSSAFYGCYSLECIAIPNSITKFGQYTFQTCYSLTSIIIPNGVTGLTSNLFHSCSSLKMASIPNSVTSISNYTFYSCSSLTSIVVPNSVTRLNQAFEYSNALNSIVLPEGLTRIEGEAFYSCKSLTVFYIPSGVTFLYTTAFGDCVNLVFIDFAKHTTIPTLQTQSGFSGIPSGCQIRVPAALYDEWIAATNWANLASQIVAV